MLGLGHDPPVKWVVVSERRGDSRAVRALPFSYWSLRATFLSTERKPVKDSRSELAQSLTG